MPLDFGDPPRACDMPHHRMSVDESNPVIRRLNWGLLQKTQIRKMPSFPVVARTPFWSFCAGQRRIGPGQITDGT